MSYSPRITLGIILILVAIILHFSLCDWVARGPVAPDERLILAKTYEYDDRVYRDTYRRSFGLITGDDVSRPTAIIFGVTTPLLLLGVAQYIFLFRKSERS